jgi:haloacid dehalogenase-like hydrolase
VKMRLKIPAGAFQAYLFDCDGTIADSMPLHYMAWKGALAEWDCDFPEDLFYAWGGFPVAEIISRVNERQGLQMPVPEVARRKEALYFDALPQLKAVPEVLEHIDAQHGRISFAVVSGSTRDSVTANLWAASDVYRHRFKLDRWNTNGYGAVLRRKHADWNRHGICIYEWAGDVYDLVAVGREPFDHRGVRW